MIDYHVIDPQTLCYKEEKTPQQGDLVEVRFVSAPHIEYIFNLDHDGFRQMCDSIYGLKRELHPPLGAPAKLDIMTYILYGQYCLWAYDNHYDNVKIQYGRAASCWYVFVSQDDQKRLYILCYERADHTYIVDDFIYPALTIANARYCSSQIYFLLPVLWNETRKCFYECCNDDNCRVRFIYPYDRRLWTEQSLSEAITKYKEQGLKI